MAANRFFVPNTEQFSEGLDALLQQCGLCCQEYSDGGLTEFLGVWDEEPVSSRYYCSVALKNSVDQKLSSHFLPRQRGLGLNFGFLFFFLVQSQISVRALQRMRQVPRE